MTLEIKMLPLGPLQTNAYLIGDNETGDAVLIDPVDNAEVIQQTAQKAGWEIKLILATHAHFDHVMASKSLKAMTGAPFALHQNEMVWLDQLPQQGLMFLGQEAEEGAEPDRFLTTESETIQVGSMTFNPLFTPGHSPGHISFYMPDHQVVISGDALFAGSIGRTDLPYCDHQTLMESIVNQLLPLGDEVQVLSGHTRPTTIGRERQTNPFILEYLERL